MKLNIKYIPEKNIFEATNNHHDVVGTGVTEADSINDFYSRLPRFKVGDRVKIVESPYYGYLKNNGVIKKVFENCYLVETTFEGKNVYDHEFDLVLTFAYDKLHVKYMGDVSG